MMSCVGTSQRHSAMMRGAECAYGKVRPSESRVFPREPTPKEDMGVRR